MSVCEIEGPGRVIFVLVLFSILSPICGNRHAGHVQRAQDLSDKKGPAPKQEEDFDFFKDDEFFKDPKLGGSSSSTLPQKNITIQIPQLQIPQIQIPQIQFPQFNFTKPALNLTQPLFGIGNGSEGILDFLAGLIGYSSTQNTVRPIILVLLAAASGIVWSLIFVYIYTSFFTGSGHFSEQGYRYATPVYRYARSLVPEMDLKTSSDLIFRAIEVLSELNESTS